MLDYSPKNLLQEVEAAEAHAKKHLAAFDSVIQVLVGSYYREDMKPTNPSPENYPYSYVANVRPRLVFRNPKFNCSSQSTAIDSKRLIYQAKFVNRWAVRENLQKVLNPFVTTALLLRSVVLMTFEDDPDDAMLPAGKMKRKMPRCHLLENHRYFRDPTSTLATPPRYKGHVWVRDLEDVKKMEGVDKDVVSTLIPDVELKKLQRPNERQGTSRETPPRFEILAYEIWVPECNDYRTNRGHNGTIFTVAVGQTVNGNETKKHGEGAFLFPPRPFYGPKWGPYTELEFVDVPGQTYGTSPVSVVMQQVEEVNAHLSATADAAARMKHLLFIDAANDTLQVAVQDSPDGSVIGIPNITKEQIIPALIGGPAPEQYQYNEIARERLDRNIGMDASQRGGGGTSQKQTATYTNVQYETLNVRMDDLKRITAEAVQQIANTAAWYGWESNNVVMRLGGDDAEEMGMTSPAYMGGPQNGEQLPTWDDAALELEPYSMEAVDEEKLAQEVTEALALIAQLAQEMQTAPWLGFDVILEQLGKLRKFDWLHECINGELFAEWMKEQVQQGMEKHQAEQAMQQAQIEGQQIQNAKTKLEMMLLMHESQQPQTGTEPKPPSVMISYKDLPEDVKREAESAAGFKPSTMPLTSPAHIANQLDVHKTNASMQHDSMQQQQGQKHELVKQESQQKHQVQQSKLAGMLKGMGGQRGGMRGRTSRRQNGPTNTAGRGQRALAESAA